MAQAKRGDTVKVHYTGKLEDGTIFDTSLNRHHLQFALGKGQVIRGFEEAVIGMNTGETKTVKIPVEQGYGARRKDMIVTVDRKQLPAGLNARTGQRLEITQADGQVRLVTVIEVTDSTITLDANHPLAGRELTFDIQLLEIV